MQWFFELKKYIIHLVQSWLFNISSFLFNMVLFSLKISVFQSFFNLQLSSYSLGSILLHLHLYLFLLQVCQSACGLPLGMLRQSNVSLEIRFRVHSRVQFSLILPFKYLRCCFKTSKRDLHLPFI